jgi:hypothetical protein
MKLIAQMVIVSATEAAEFDLLKMLPNTFIRIQFWGVSRETLQVNLSMKYFSDFSISY